MEDKQDIGAYFDVTALTHTLDDLAASIDDKIDLRQKVFLALKGAFVTARGKVREDVEQNGLHGLKAAQALSAIQDSFIRILFFFAVNRFYADEKPGRTEHLAIVATGGYGRGELAPGSDIDLLFIRDGRPTHWGETVIEFILYILWDLGLKVGHATRSLTDCMRQGKMDITICTALLEARYLTGEVSLYEKLRKRFWAEIATGNGREFVEAKLAERDERHVHQGESRYLVEPNIKEGKGGLRDLQTLYWIGKYLYHVYDAEALVRENVFTRDEYEIFQKAEAFLWNVRVHLHYRVGRAEERLLFDYQPSLAAALGFTDENPRVAVEKFMRAYFLVAKDVGDLTRIFCAALEMQNRKKRAGLTRILPGFLLPKTSNDAFFVDTGRLNAAEGIFEKDPSNFIRIFKVADEKDIDIHPHALRTITRQQHLIDDALREDPRAGALFLEVVSSKHNPEWALRMMNEAGVLGAFMPEFGRIVALMQFNMYHHYTVDEHLIRAIGHVAAIEHGTWTEEHPLATRVVHRLKSREVLYCAVLLHDIAKGLPGDHSELGGAIAETVCPRFGLSRNDTETVAWLVRHHLVMSDVAQRRDISDPKTVRDFVSVVQSPELLRYLLILTVADICAVGPGVWNGWKAQLLRDLYDASNAIMSGEDAKKSHSAKVRQAVGALEERIQDIAPEMRKRILERQYDNYWLALETDTHVRHAYMLAQADEKGTLFAFDAYTNEARGVTEVTVWMPDHAGIFAHITGAIAMSGANIVDAKVFTSSDGFALDVFSLLDGDGQPFSDPERLERLSETIERTLAGELYPRNRLVKADEKNRQPAFHVPARVNFDNEASTFATVVEVRGADRPGFLHDVATAFFESGLSLSAALIATYGERVVDVFYVRDAFGHKITHPEKRKAVEARLLDAVSGIPTEKSKTAQQS